MSSGAGRVKRVYNPDMPIPAKSRVDAGHLVRSAIRFALAAGAVGSGAYTAYQMLVPNNTQSGTVATYRAQNSNERSFFQALIDADRQSMKSIDTNGSASALSGLFASMNSGNPRDRVAATQSDDDRSENSLRWMFSGDAAASRANRPETGWKAAFMNGSEQQKPDRVAAAVPLPSPPRAPAPPAAVSEGGPSPQSAVSAGQPASPPNNPVAKSTPERADGFREQAIESRNSGGFAVVSRSAPQGVSRQVTQPEYLRQDDAQFASTVLTAAELDVGGLPRARAVVAEFKRRFPQAAENQLIQARLERVELVHRRALQERTTLRSDTEIAPVLFSDAGRKTLSACLARAPGLKQLEAVNRPVSGEQSRLAFLVAARFDESEIARIRAGNPPDNDVFAHASRYIGPCILPFFQQGTVALMVHGAVGDDLTLKRISGLPAATIFGRPPAAAEMTAVSRTRNGADKSYTGSTIPKP